MAYLQQDVWAFKDKFHDKRSDSYIKEVFDRKFQKPFLHSLYISYHMSSQAVSYANHPFLYNKLDNIGSMPGLFKGEARFWKSGRKQ